MINADTEYSGRLLAIGDIHGCQEQLQQLIRQVKPTTEDQVVFLGDYVDRGPDSAGVIEYLIEFGKTFPQTIFLRGNHEQMFLNYLDDKDPSLFLINGGINTLDSYRRKDWLPIPEPHLEFLQALQMSFICDRYIFVHAGLRPGVPPEQQDESDLLWIRQDFISSDYDWDKTVVYGHTPLQKPFFANHRIGLDTGCVYGRQLTCCDVKTREIWQAEASSG